MVVCCNKTVSFTLLLERKIPGDRKKRSRVEAVVGVSNPGSPVCLSWEHHWEHLAVGVENALSEPQPAAFSWECLAQTHHCSKAVREHHIKNCFLKIKCLSELGVLGACWLIPPLGWVEGASFWPPVVGFFSSAWSVSEGRKKLTALLGSGSLCKEDLFSHCA